MLGTLTVGTDGCNLFIGEFVISNGVENLSSCIGLVFREELDDAIRLQEKLFRYVLLQNVGNARLQLEGTRKFI